MLGIDVAPERIELASSLGLQACLRDGAEDSAQAITANRGFDNVIHDVAIQNLPVIFGLDRAGMVGADGQTHMGLYDIAYMLAVPNMTVTAPKDGAELVGLLKCALEHEGPFSLRYPRDTVPSQPPQASDVEPVPYGTWERLRQGEDVALLAAGVMCAPAMEAAERLAADGHDVTVINCRFIKPLDHEMLADLVRTHRFILTIEDGTAVNGFGAYVAAKVEELDPAVRVVIAGAPDRTFEHASRSDQLAEAGLSSEALADSVRAWALAEQHPTS